MNQKLLKYLLLAILKCGLISSMAISQEVAVSRDINIRSDYAYFILGQVEDNILLYRDKGFEHKLVAFDTLLQYKWEQQLTFDKKNVQVYGVASRDSFFNVYFGFKDNGIEFLKVNRYNARAELVDSTTIFSGEDFLFRNDYQFCQSEDESKTVLYSLNDEFSFKLFAIDNDSLGLYWEDEFDFENANLFQELSEILITNGGEVLILLEKNNTTPSIEDHIVEVILLSRFLTEGLLTSLPLKDKISQDIRIAYDHRNGKIGIIGLFNEKNTNWSQGFFHCLFSINYLGQDRVFDFTSFGQDLLYDLYGKDAEKRKGLNYHQISKLLWRIDGGIVFVTEMQREFSRRSNYDVVGRNQSDYYGLRGWTDYYNEDMVVFSIHPDGRTHWNKVLYKKQFSQDDGGIYSSFFLFKTPSRLRLIFNDEIKNNNTVSEYVLDPVGQFRRESLLSTEYQKLKLRFKDAYQLSNHEIIVPSERSHNLSLVKITYL